MVHVCWSEHSDSSFVYGFMILNYGFGTMTATTFIKTDCNHFHLSSTLKNNQSETTVCYEGLKTAINLAKSKINAPER